jgi:hypothetical protein
LKIAALFELVIATAENKKSHTIRPEALELAIAHVAENMKAVDYLFRRAQLFTFG